MMYQYWFINSDKCAPLVDDRDVIMGEVYMCCLWGGFSELVS